MEFHGDTKTHPGKRPACANVVRAKREIRLVALSDSSPQKQVQHWPGVAGGAAQLKTSPAQASGEIGNAGDKLRVFIQNLHLHGHEIGEDGLDVCRVGWPSVLFLPLRVHVDRRENPPNVILLEEAHVPAYIRIAKLNAAIGEER